MSCSPFRVPIARLAAAQAAIKESQCGKTAAQTEIEEKVAAAKAALLDAAGRLQAVAGDATDEVKDAASAALKSLKAGWEEAKKTFGEERSK